MRHTYISGFTNPLHRIMNIFFKLYKQQRLTSEFRVPEINRFTSLNLAYKRGLASDIKVERRRSIGHQRKKQKSFVNYLIPSLKFSFQVLSLNFPQLKVDVMFGNQLWTQAKSVHRAASLIFTDTSGPGVLLSKYDQVQSCPRTISANTEKTIVC